MAESDWDAEADKLMSCVLADHQPAHIAISLRDAYERGVREEREACLDALKQIHDQLETQYWEARENLKFERRDEIGFEQHGVCGAIDAIRARGEAKP